MPKSLDTGAAVSILIDMMFTPTERNAMYSASLEARARARRDGGPLSTVEFDHKQDGRVVVSEAPYDALGLARSLVANGSTNVVYTTPSGVVYRDEQIRGVRY